MGDIFISYAREDRERAQLLAETLERRGWSVWWDHKIPPGKTFDEVINDALEKARCAIVLWSKTSVNSNWVKEEATDAAQRGILLPAMIDEVELPLGFRRMQCAQLSSWYQGVDEGGFDQLIEAVVQLLGTTPRAQSSQPRTKKSQAEPQQASYHAQRKLLLQLIAGDNKIRVLKISNGKEDHILKFTYRGTMTQAYQIDLDGKAIHRGGNGFSDGFNLVFDVTLFGVIHSCNIKGTMGGFITKVKSFAFNMNGEVMYAET